MVTPRLKARSATSCNQRCWAAISQGPTKLAVALVPLAMLAALLLAACDTVLQPPSLPPPPADVAPWTTAYRYAIEQLFQVPTNTIVFRRNAEAEARRDLQRVLPAYEIAPCSDGEMDSETGVRRRADHRPGLFLSVTRVKRIGDATELRLIAEQRAARFGTVTLQKSEGGTRWRVASATLVGIADPEPPPHQFTLPLEKWVEPPMTGKRKR